MAVATSKPTVFADIVLKHFNIHSYFTYVVGSNMDGTRTNKAEVIAEVLRRMDLSYEQTVIMVGDREYDILGAKKHGIAAIGVEYGFAAQDELEQAGADFIANTVWDLRGLLLK